MKKASETTNLIIGQFYQVPTVDGLIANLRTHWPVIGPKHEDAEYIDFPHQHYHIDWRFLCQTECDYLGRFYKDIFTWVLHEPNILGPVVYRRRSCKRQMPIFPRSMVKWLDGLSKAYKDHVLKDDLICPHRGASLAGLEVDSEGCITCPLHGLRWNLKTRQLAAESD